jgi:diketogulonate reductase-like aldo/keto reductase
MRRLGFDYVDLFLLHHPVPSDFDGTVAAYKAAEQMLADRRARAIGVSNFSPQHLENLMRRTDVVPAVNQVELHPFFTQQTLREFHAANGIATQAWSPLGGVTRYRPAGADAIKNPLEHPTIQELAAKYQKAPAASPRTTSSSPSYPARTRTQAAPLGSSSFGNAERSDRATPTPSQNRAPRVSRYGAK